MSAGNRKRRRVALLPQTLIHTRPRYRGPSGMMALPARSKKLSA